MIAERGRKVESEVRDFTPFTPFSGSSVQALISRWFAVVRMHSLGRIWSLFSITYQIPKLDVMMRARVRAEPRGHCPLGLLAAHLMHTNLD